MKPGEECNIVKIVVQTLLEKFPTNILVLREVAKILEKSEYVDKSVVTQVKDSYRALKNGNCEALLTLARH